MTERERLIELIGSKVCEDYSPNCDEWQPHSCEKCYANDCRIGELADYLLANGVIVPPCKVGDKLKQNRNRYIEMIDTYLEEPHSISADWVELLKIMREIIEGAENDES